MRFASGARRRVTARSRELDQRKGEPVPSYYLIPWSLVALSLVLTGLLYWGGFVEERRNGRTRG
jgi:hypothetical protein